jgi:hypothetical protein
MRTDKLKLLHHYTLSLRTSGFICMKTGFRKHISPLPILFTYFVNEICEEGFSQTYLTIAHSVYVLRE